MKKIFLLLGFYIQASIVFGQWNADPNVNNIVANSSDDDLYPIMASDGANGSIIFFSNLDETKIFAQRINALGKTVWNTSNNPVNLCDTSNTRYLSRCIADGAGGAYVSWTDFRYNADAGEIYIQHISSSGTILWGANGLRVTQDISSNDYDPALCTDGSGGLIVCWGRDNFISSMEVYAQRYNAAGIAQWATGGVLSCVSPGFRETQDITSDGNNGAIIFFTDTRNDPHGLDHADWDTSYMTNEDIYAQRLNENGTRLWNNTGIPVCTAAGNQYFYDVCVVNNNGGAIIVYTDGRNDIVAPNGDNTNLDIFAQSINSNGVAQWAANGVALVTAAGNQHYSDAISDGAGGVVAGWWQIDVSASNAAVQRITAAGASVWGANGLTVTVPGGYGLAPAFAADGSGNFICTYTGDSLKAQKISPAGNKLWPAAGIAVSAHYTSYPKIMATDNGKAIISWADKPGADFDIFASEIGADGVLSDTGNHWNYSSYINNVVSNANPSEYYPVVVTDSAGGSISFHYNTVDYHLYAQRITVSGAIAWGTTANPILITNGSVAEYNAIADGQGGAFVGSTVQIFDPVNVGHFSLYIQHINASGVKLWGLQGILVSDTLLTTFSPYLCSDGAGGVIISWNNRNMTTNNQQPFIQRYNSNGIAQWAQYGMPVYTGSGKKFAEAMISDGNNGAILFLTDNTISGNADVYAQHINGSGNPLWTVAGVPVSVASGNQQPYQHGNLVTDGNGGAIFIFDDTRNGNYDIYAQRLNSSGIAQWATNGIAVATSAGNQFLYNTVDDGSGGFVSSFYDENLKRIYSQRISAAGSILWGVGAVVVNGLSESITDSEGDLIADGHGNYIYFYQTGTIERIEAQKINSSGIVQWASGKIIRNNFSGSFNDLHAVLSDNGNTIATWTDSRNAATTGNDIFASKILNTGVLAGNYATIASGNWNNPAIWLGGIVPPAGAQVTVSNNVTVTANVTCYSLTVLPAATVHVNTGIQLTVLN